MTPVLHSMKVNDRWMFRYLYPALAVFSVHVGNDNSLPHLLTIPSYYTDILLALLCSFGAGLYFRRLYRALDLKRDVKWDRPLRVRTHIFKGVLLPAVVIMSIELLYLRTIGVSWRHSSIFYLEFPVTVILCSGISLLYYNMYQLAHTRALRLALESHTVPAESSPKVFIVKSGAQSQIVQLSEVAYFMVQNQVTFLVTTTGKRWMYDQPMREVSRVLPPTDFFQLNRQLVASRQSIRKYVRTPTRKLEIELAPPLPEPQYVAKAKYSEFIDWLGR